MKALSRQEDRDAYENSYYYFIKQLEVLAASPEEACELLGHSNVAFGVKFDLEGSDYIFNYDSCSLEAEQRQAIIELLDDLNTIPPAVLRYTEVASMSLKNMGHACWTPLRKKAQNLLKLLELNTQANNLYFHG